MARATIWIATLLPMLAVLAIARPAAADVASVLDRYLDLEATMQTVLLWKTDSDFDGTEPEYDEHGQSIGLIGTFFKPGLTLHATDQFTLYYELELGLNLWSQHDPAQDNAGQSDAFLIRHRELWAAGSFRDPDIDFKVGYQYLRDPTGLLIGHWIGAVDLGLTFGDTRLSVVAGQVPDQTYEGIEISRNNFVHDVFAGGLRADHQSSDSTAKYRLSAGFYALYDGSDVRQERKVFGPAARFEVELERLLLGVDAMFQFGGLQRHGLGDQDAQHLAWAAQLEAVLDLDPLTLEAHLLALSPDDEFDHNNTNHAFLYSGKSRSRTIILTEDEIRDMGGNLDERLGERLGSFTLLRGGLIVADVCAALDLELFQPAVIVGAGFMTQPENSMGESFVGLETALDLGLRYEELLEFHFVAAVMVPGGAAGPGVNAIDADKTDVVTQVEASLSLHF